MQLRAAFRKAMRSVGYDDQLSVVDHLDELRTRIIVSLLAVAVAFAFCFWQNGALLQVVNAPLAHQTEKQVGRNGPLGATYTVQRSARDIGVQLRLVVTLLERSSEPVAVRSTLTRAGASLARDVKRLSAPPSGDKPITLGIGEPFTTTVTVSLIFALILALPVVLMQLYGFLVPALDGSQRRRLRPLVSAVPVLLAAGVAFGYFVVLPAAIHFLQNFNSGQFNVLVQASQYYKFAATTLLAMGVLFQLPVVVLLITRAGVITPRQFRRNRRYAIAACAGR